MRFFPALALMSLFSLQAEAACPRPSDAPPAIPDGRTADESQIKTARGAIQDYVNKLEAYDRCLKDLEANPPADATPQQRAAWIAAGEAAIDSAQMLAAEFSAALQQFKARAATPQSK